MVFAILKPIVNMDEKGFHLNLPDFSVPNPFDNPFTNMIGKAINCFGYDVFQTFTKALGELLITFNDPLTYFKDYNDYVSIIIYIALGIAIVNFKVAIVKNSDLPMGSPFKNAARLFFEFGATVAFIYVFPNYLYTTGTWFVKEVIKIVAYGTQDMAAYEKILAVLVNIGFAGIMGAIGMLIFLYFVAKILFASGKRFVDVLIFYLLTIYSAAFFMVNPQKFYTSVQELFYAIITPLLQIILIKWTFISLQNLNSFVDFFVTLALLETAANVQNILRYAGHRASSGNGGAALTSTIKTAAQVIGTVA